MGFHFVSTTRFDFGSTVRVHVGSTIRFHFGSTMGFRFGAMPYGKHYALGSLCAFWEHYVLPFWEH